VVYAYGRVRDRTFPSGRFAELASDVHFVFVLMGNFIRNSVRRTSFTRSRPLHALHTAQHGPWRPRYPVHPPALHRTGRRRWALIDGFDELERMLSAYPALHTSGFIFVTGPTDPAHAMT
jgi:hypothetical protein